LPASPFIAGLRDLESRSNQVGKIREPVAMLLVALLVKRAAS
jgi:hypothetical protein